MQLKDNPATQLVWKIAIIYRLHMQNISGVAESFGLYPGQQRILYTILDMNGSTQKELADKLDISPASLAVSVKRMQKAGIVEKAADSSDLRNNRIFLTEKGRQILLDSGSEFIRLDNNLVEGFDSEEISRLHALLSRIEANLKKAKSLNMESL